MTIPKRQTHQTQKLVWHSVLLLLSFPVVLVSLKNAINHMNQDTSHVKQVAAFDQNVQLVYDEKDLLWYMYKRRLDLLNESTIMSIGSREDFFYPWFVQHNLAQHPKFVKVVTPNNETEYSYIFSDLNESIIFGGTRAGICKPATAFLKSNGSKKHVLIMAVNENWGAFSSLVQGRTINWGDFWNTWKNDGCNHKEQLFEYLNHPNVSAVFTTTHQSSIAPHPKVHSLPIGVLSGNTKRLTEELRVQPEIDKSQLLMINFNSDSEYSNYGRLNIEKKVIANFNGMLENTYKKRVSKDSYWQELHRSKFVLSPPGLGWDTYRSWEALMLGAIPVLETYYRNDGFYKVYDDLPVLWVDHYDNVTPALLEEVYSTIVSKAHQYKFEKLTKQYWVDLVFSYVGS